MEGTGLLFSVNVQMLCAVLIVECEVDEVG
jgi:hypothetical protein